MKRTLLFCMTVCLMATSSIMAQTTTSSSETNTANERTRFGVKLGIQGAGVKWAHGDKFDEHRIPGFTGGVFMQIPLQKKEVSLLNLNIDLLYSPNGEKSSNKKDDDTKYYLNYLDIPVMLKAYLMKSKTLYLEAGPYIGFLFSDNDKDYKTNTVDYGVSAGIGTNFGSKDQFEVGIRGNLGLNDIYPEYNYTPKSHSKQYNYSGALTVAYLFGGNGEKKEVVSQETITENNEKVNDMKQEVKAQEPKPEPKPSPRPEPVVAKPEFTPEAVYFDLNKSNIKTTESSKIDAATKFLKENPDYKVRLVGYADRQTGSASYNLKISKRRVDAVRDYMINKGNIAASRITADYEGDKVQPEASNDKNRCVTIYVTE